MRMGARTARGRMVLGVASAGLLLTVAACSGSGGSGGSGAGAGPSAGPGTSANGGGQASSGQTPGGQTSGGNGVGGKGAGSGPETSTGTATNPAANPGTEQGTDAKRAPRFSPGGVDSAISREAEAEAGGRSIALTIDDGPDPRYTPQMLDLLKQHNAKATFCMLGPAAKAHPDLVKRVVAEGHRLCNHSMSHNVRQSDRSADYNRHEITEANRLIREAAGPGAKVWYYRAPGGDFTPWIREIAVENDLRPLGWNVDPGDWKREGADKILASLEQQIRPGRVVLVHDGGGERSQSVTALKGLLEHLDAEGYTYSFPKS